MQKRRESLHRTQIGVKTQALAHREQSLFGTDFSLGIIVKLGISYSAEQHRIAIHTGPEGLLGESIRVLAYRAGSYIATRILCLMAFTPADSINSLDRLGYDFRSYSVSRKQCNLHFHILMS